MIVHTVNKNTEALHRCLLLVADQDAVLLIEDAVYAAMDSKENKGIWENVPAHVKKYVMVDDLAVRGISDRMLPFFEPIGWHEFVSLSLEYEKVISWG